ncbi:hypothetical protein ON010_g624 [Phytophthora cinnamomi]|nr:hypothetical protein ON010_g624 [Phytophthora cinnamomi]
MKFHKVSSNPFRWIVFLLQCVVQDRVRFSLDQSTPVGRGVFVHRPNDSQLGRVHIIITTVAAVQRRSLGPFGFLPRLNALVGDTPRDTPPQRPGVDRADGLRRFEGLHPVTGLVFRPGVDVAVSHTAAAILLVEVDAPVSGEVSPRDGLGLVPTRATGKLDADRLGGVLVREIVAVFQHHEQLDGVGFLHVVEGIGVLEPVSIFGLMTAAPNHPNNSNSFHDLVKKNVSTTITAPPALVGLSRERVEYIRKRVGPIRRQISGTAPLNVGRGVGKRAVDVEAFKCRSSLGDVAGLSRRRLREIQLQQRVLVVPEHEGPEGLCLFKGLPPVDMTSRRLEVVLVVPELAVDGLEEDADLCRLGMLDGLAKLNALAGHAPREFSLDWAGVDGLDAARCSERVLAVRSSVARSRVHILDAADASVALEEVDVPVCGEVSPLHGLRSLPVRAVGKLNTHGLRQTLSPSPFHPAKVGMASGIQRSQPLQHGLPHGDNQSTQHQFRRHVDVVVRQHQLSSKVSVQPSINYIHFRASRGRRSAAYIHSFHPSNPSASKGRVIPVRDDINLARFPSRRVHGPERPRPAQQRDAAQGGHDLQQLQGFHGQHEAAGRRVVDQQGLELPAVLPVGRVAHVVLGSAHRQVLAAPLQLADEQHGGRGAVARHVVLRRGGARDQRRRRVLDLHLVQQHVAVLGELDLAGAAHQHLERAARAWTWTEARVSGGSLGLQDTLFGWRARTEVGLEHALEALGGAHVDHERLRLAHDLGVGVHAAVAHAAGVSGLWCSGRRGAGRIAISMVAPSLSEGTVVLVRMCEPLNHPI